VPTRATESVTTQVNVGRSPRPLRLALLIQLAPRKLGSLEDWLVAFATEARRRGHSFDLFAHEPVHPTIRGALEAVGARWETIASFTRRPWTAVRRLAREYDVMHLNFVAPNDRLAMIAYAAWPTPILYVDHNSMTAGVDARRSRFGAALDDLTRLRLAGLAGVSNYVRDRARERYRVTSPFVETIYNGVDTKRFAPAATPRPATGDIVITAAAYLIAEKGIAGLLRAVALARPTGIRIHIVGDGPEEVPLRALARELGLDGCTTFFGLRNDLPDVLRETDIFVHPVLWEEAFGLTIAEAMASGCAIIASRIGAIPELIDSGESGILVPAGDVEALANAISSLVSDRAERTRLAAGARRRAETLFRLDASVDAHLDWCERIAAEHLRR